MAGDDVRRRQGQRGQGVTEFALVIPVVILMLVGLFDLGRAVYAYNTISNAARDGARVAAVNQIQTSPDCVESHPVENPATPHWSIATCAADAAISLGVQASDVAVSYYTPAGITLDCSNPPLNVGCIARVTVHYIYRPMTPVVGNILGPITMDSTSEMPIERVFP